MDNNPINNFKVIRFGSVSSDINRILDEYHKNIQGGDVDSNKITLDEYEVIIAEILGKNRNDDTLMVAGKKVSITDIISELKMMFEQTYPQGASIKEFIEWINLDSDDDIDILDLLNRRSQGTSDARGSAGHTSTTPPTDSTNATDSTDTADAINTPKSSTIDPSKDPSTNPSAPPSQNAPTNSIVKEGDIVSLRFAKENNGLASYKLDAFFGKAINTQELVDYFDVIGIKGTKSQLRAFAQDIVASLKNNPDLRHILNDSLIKASNGDFSELINWAKNLNSDVSQVVWEADTSKKFLTDNASTQLTRKTVQDFFGTGPSQIEIQYLLEFYGFEADSADHISDILFKDFIEKSDDMESTRETLIDLLFTKNSFTYNTKDQAQNVLVQNLKSYIGINEDDDHAFPQSDNSVTYDPITGKKIGLTTQEDDSISVLTIEEFLGDGEDISEIKITAILNKLGVKKPDKDLVTALAELGIDALIDLLSAGQGGDYIFPEAAIGALYDFSDDFDLSELQIDGADSLKELANDFDTTRTSSIKRSFRKDGDPAAGIQKFFGIYASRAEISTFLDVMGVDGELGADSEIVNELHAFINSYDPTQEDGEGIEAFILDFFIGVEDTYNLETITPTNFSKAQDVFQTNLAAYLIDNEIVNGGDINSLGIQLPDSLYTNNELGIYPGSGGSSTNIPEAGAHTAPGGTGPDPASGPASSAYPSTNRLINAFDHAQSSGTAVLEEYSAQMIKVPSYDNTLNDHIISNYARTLSEDVSLEEDVEKMEDDIQDAFADANKVLPPHNKDILKLQLAIEIMEKGAKNKNMPANLKNEFLKSIKDELNNDTLFLIALSEADSIEDLLPKTIKKNDDTPTNNPLLSATENVDRRKVKDYDDLKDYIDDIDNYIDYAGNVLDINSSYPTTTTPRIYTTYYDDNQKIDFDKIEKIGSETFTLPNIFNITIGKSIDETARNFVEKIYDATKGLARISDEEEDQETLDEQKEKLEDTLRSLKASNHPQADAMAVAIAREMTNALLTGAWENKTSAHAIRRKRSDHNASDEFWNMGIDAFQNAFGDQDYKIIYGLAIADYHHRRDGGDQVSYASSGEISTHDGDFRERSTNRGRDNKAARLISNAAEDTLISGELPSDIEDLGHLRWVGQSH